MKPAALLIAATALAGCAGGGELPVAATLSASDWQVLSQAQSNQLSRITAAGVVHAAGVLGDQPQTVLTVMCSENQPSMIVLVVDGTTQRQQGEIANVIFTADRDSNLGMEFGYGDRLLFVEGVDAVRVVTLMQRAASTIDVSVDGERDIRFAADTVQSIEAVTSQCRAAWPGGGNGRS